MEPKTKRWLLVAAMAILAVVAYLPVAHAGWIWDDDSYLTANPALRVEDGLRLIWTPGGTPQYYPLVFTSFWLESRVLGPDFDLSPFLFHAVNVLLHLASSILLWRLLSRLGVPAAWLAAAIFLVHPMQVESVAWVTERKNTLSLVLALCSLLAWLRFSEDAEDPDDARPWGWWWTSLGLFIAAMLAKTTVAAVAPTLVLIELWRGRNWNWSRLGLIAPFFLVGVPLGLLTAWLERSHVGAGGEEFGLGPIDRLLLAPRAAFFYLTTFVWPSRLAFVYPRWTIDPSQWTQWIPLLLALVAAVAAVIGWRRGQRGPLLLLGLYVVALFPALGFIDVYPFRYSYVADHFAYLGAIPLSIAVAALGSRIAARLKPAGQLGAGFAFLVVLAGLSHAQATAYRDEETLWRASLEANPEAWMPASNLSGLLLAQAGRAIDGGQAERGQDLATEAEQFARQAIDRSPRQFTAWTNLSEALRLKGKLDDALAAADKAAELAPAVADAHWLRGRLLEAKGDLPGAIEAYRKAVEGPEGQRAPRPTGPGPRGRRLDLARVLSKSGRDAEAVPVYEALLAANAADAMAAANLGLIQMRLGDPAKARASFRTALAAAPDEVFVVRLVPAFIDSLLAPPSEPTAAKEACDIAEWLWSSGPARTSRSPWPSWLAAKLLPEKGKRLLRQPRRRPPKRPRPRSRCSARWRNS